MSDSCESCGHDWEFHQPDGCWFAVSQARQGTDTGCPCSVPVVYDTVELSNFLIGEGEDEFKHQVLTEIDPYRIADDRMRSLVNDARIHYSALESTLTELYEHTVDLAWRNDVT